MNTASVLCCLLLVYDSCHHHIYGDEEDNVDKHDQRDAYVWNHCQIDDDVCQLQ